MQFDIEGARRVGYSDDEIADFLAREGNFDIRGARDAGYGSTDIIDFLSKQKAKPAPEPKPKKDERTILDRAKDVASTAGDFMVNGTLAGDAYRAVKGALFPEKPKSVMDGAEAPKTSLIESRGGPVRQEVADAARRQLALATPEQRAAAEEQPGWKGSVARAQNAVLAGNEAAPEPLRRGLEVTRQARERMRREDGLAPEAASERAVSDIVAGRGTSALPSLVPDVVGERAAQEGAKTAEEYKDAGFWSRVGGEAKERMTKGALGAAQFLADVAGDEEFAYNLGASAKVAAARGEAIPKGDSQFVKSAQQAMTSLATQAPTMVLGALTGTAVPMLAQIGVEVFGSEYADGRAAGLSAEAAGSRAALFSAAEVFFERFGLADKFAAIRIATDSVLKRALADGVDAGSAARQAATYMGKSIAKELPSELATEASQTLVDMAPKIGLRPDITLDEFLQNMGETVRQTVLQAGATATVAVGGAAAGDVMHGRNPLSRGTDARTLADELDSILAGGRFDPQAIDRVARESLSADTGISPTETSILRDVPDAGRIEPNLGSIDGINVGGAEPGITNFTEPDSASAAAGLTPIVVPDAVARFERDANGEPVQVPESFTEREQAPGVNTGPLLGLLDNAAQQAGSPTVAADGRRVGDEWSGRRGAGYETEGDARLQIPARERKNPGLDYEVVQTPAGKFKLVGYVRESASAAGIQPRQDAQTGAPVSGPSMPVQGAPAAAQQPAAATQAVQSPNAPALEPAPAQPAQSPAPIQSGVSTGSVVARTREGAQGTAVDAGPGVAPGAKGLADQRGQPSAPAAAPSLSPDEKARVLQVVNAHPGVMRIGGVVEAETDEVIHPLIQGFASLYNRPTMAVEVTEKGAILPFNGAWVDRRAIVIDKDSSEPVIGVVTHEVFHPMDKDLKERFIEAMRPHVTDLAEFVRRQQYSHLPEAKQLEELAAFFAQEEATKPQFWEEMRKALGDTDFGKIAGLIIRELDRVLNGMRSAGVASKYLSRPAKLRNALAEVYAEQLRRNGNAAAANEILSADQGTARLVAESQAPGRSADGDRGVAPTQDGGVPQSTKRGALARVVSRAKALGVELDVDESGEDINLNNIERVAGSGGAGADVMQELIDYADSNEKYIRLSATNRKLVGYYKKLGFEVEPGQDGTDDYILMTREPDFEMSARPRVALNPEKVGNPSPIASMVPTKDAEDRINRRLNRAPGVGRPGNARRILEADGERFAVGQITPQDWLAKNRFALSKAELKEARVWYRQLHDFLTPVFGADAPRYALAWLLSQKNESPSGGMRNVMRASDIAGGKPQLKRAGLNHDNLVAVLSGGMPQGGVAAKLMDFVDSELGLDVRTWMGYDARGRQPAAIDVWAFRDAGFVDETVLTYIRKTFGDEVADSIEIDKSTGETQYEYGIDFYNDVVEYLNSIDFDGGGWTAREVQAVGWVGTQRLMNIQAEFVADIVDANTRRVSLGLGAGEGSPVAKHYPGKEIDAEYAQRAVREIAEQANVKILGMDVGAGAYMTSVEGSIQIDALASPESISDFMDMVGYALQQTEMIATRPLKYGGNTALDVFAEELGDLTSARRLFDAILQAQGESVLTPGFQQIKVDGKSGIRFLNFDGKWSKRDLAKIVESIHAAESSAGITITKVEHTTVDLTSTKNDWTKQKTGRSYLDSLRGRGRVREAQWLASRYAPSRADLGVAEAQLSTRTDGSSEPAGRPGRGSGEGAQRGIEDARGWSKRDPRPEAVSVDAWHYGQGKYPVLSGSMYGSGIRGRERDRINASSDPRIKRRVYFYIPKSDGTLPGRETGLGPHRYEIKLANLYDASKGDVRIPQATAETFESDVLDAGYDGYVNRSLGMAVVLNADVPARYVGNQGSTTGDVVDQNRREPEPQARLKKSLLSREIGPATEVASKFPGARVRNGSMEIDAGDRDAVNDEMRAAGIDVMFSSKSVQAVLDRATKAPHIGLSRETPPVLRAVGVRNLPMAIGSDVIIKLGEGAAGTRNTMSAEQIAKLPAKIWDPVAIFTYGKDGDGTNVLFMDGGKLWVAGIKVDAKAGRVDVNEFRTAFPFEETAGRLAGANAAMKDRVRYVSKGAVFALPTSIRHHFPVLVQAARSPNGNGTRAQVLGELGDAAFTPPSFSTKPARTQTYTPEFKRWFGKSKIVNWDGSPKIMYHGTAQDIRTFRAKQAGAIFVTEDPMFAVAFAHSSQNWMVKNIDQVLSPEDRKAAKAAALAEARRDYGTSKAGKEVIDAIKFDLDEYSGEAEDYLARARSRYLPSSQNIMPVYVRATNPFDFNDPDHVRRVAVAVAEDPARGQAGNEGFIGRMIDLLESGNWEEIERPDVQAAIRREGFDGFYVVEGEQKNLAVYESRQLKSATGNRGTFDPENPDISMSTKTWEFKRWFGDSKVVDENGEPLVVYHGTSYNFSEFSSEDAPYRGGILAFFSTSPKFSGQYAGKSDGANVMPVHIRVENPFDFRVDGVRRARDFYEETGGLSDQMEINRVKMGLGEDVDIMDDTGPLSQADFVKAVSSGSWDALEAPEFVEWLRNWGYDGIVTRENGAINYAVFDPGQIKSATGNNGQFDPENPDITMSSKLNPFGRDALGRIQFKPGAAAYEKTAALVSPILSVLQLKPASKEMKARLRELKTAIARSQDLSANIAGEMFKLTADERELMSDLIEGELAAGVTPPAHIAKIATKIAAAMEAQTNELVRLGMLSQESADMWRGKYLPRFYESKLGGKITDPWLKAAAAFMRQPKIMRGISGQSLRGRGMFETISVDDLEQYEGFGWVIRDEGYKPGVDKEVRVWRDFTRDERESMGEIRDAGFRFTMGYMRSQKDIALGRVFERIANTEASRLPKAGYVRVPDSVVEGTFVRRYGKLAGMYVHRDVFTHLKAFDDTSAYDGILEMYRKGLSLWKEGKTVLNPVSHVNNTVSNITMAHFAGVSYWDAHKYVGAVRDLVKGGPMVEEARDAGLFGGTFSKEELLKTMPEQLRMLANIQDSKGEKIANRVWDALSFWVRKPAGKLYEGEDLFFRYLIYRDARARGMDPEGAVDLATMYIFNYDDLPGGARLIRDAGIPFFAYTYKAIPALLHTALTHPHRMIAPAAVLWGVNAMMYAIATGDDDEEWTDKVKKYLTDDTFRSQVRQREESERANLPEWMKGNTYTLGTPKTIRLGTDELTSLPLFMDVSRIVPAGDLLDMNANAGGVPWLQPLTPSNPLFTTAMAMFGNRDMWSGRDIVDKGLDTSAEASHKRASWAWRQFAPAIALGNYHWDRGMQAVAHAMGEPISWWPSDFTGIGRDGTPVQPRYAAMQTVGLKVRPIDLEESEKIQRSMQKKLLRDLTSRINRIKRLEKRGAISEAQAEIEIGREQEKRERLKAGLDINGKPRD